MGEKKPIPGEFYRHFKGGLYQIKMLAKNSETGGEVVVYQGMYAPFQNWVRPLEEFLEPVDTVQYSEVSQKMRFERVSVGDPGAETKRMSVSGNGKEQMIVVDKEMQQQDNLGVDDAELMRAIELGKAEKYLAGRITEKEIAERGVMQILDAPTFHEKRQLMVGLKPYLDKRLLHNIAAALDIVLEEGELEEQYDSLLHCIDTLEHYEGGRLR